MPDWFEHLQSEYMNSPLYGTRFIFSQGLDKSKKVPATPRSSVPRIGPEPEAQPVQTLVWTGSEWKPREW